MYDGNINSPLSKDIVESVETSLLRPMHMTLCEVTKEELSKVQNAPDDVIIMAN